LTAVAVATLLAACGGGESSDSNERAGTYQLQVVDASFPAEQRLGQTSMLRLAVRNTGEETVPNLTVTVGLGGKRGEDSAIPFAILDPQAELAQGYRPVWVLESHYPRLAGSPDPAGATTSNRNTFAFGKLEPDETRNVVWRLSAVKAGDWKLVYGVGAGLGSQVKAETADGAKPGGTIVAEITSELPETEVTDAGEVVEIGSRERSGGE
jgi:hypothetical protein